MIDLINITINNIMNNMTNLWNEKHNVFFSETGLTSTSANFIANKAKEIYDTPSKILSSISFLNYEIAVPATMKEGYQVNDGVTLDAFKEAVDSIKGIGELKALIAWLREAIKAKQCMLSEIRNTPDSKIMDILGQVLEPEPIIKRTMTEDDALATLSIKERCRYYTLETMCSNLGKLIHPQGVLVNALKDLKARTLNPTKIVGNGQDLTVTTYKPSAKAADVEAILLSLQEQHRSYQAELNGIKHKLEIMVQEDHDRVLKEHRIAYDDWCSARSQLVKAIEAYKEEQCNYVNNLKIVIPNELKTAYEIVKAAGCAE